VTTDGQVILYPIATGQRLGSVIVCIYKDIYYGFGNGDLIIGLVGL